MKTRSLGPELPRRLRRRLDHSMRPGECVVGLIAGARLLNGAWIRTTEQLLHVPAGRFARTPWRAWALAGDDNLTLDAENVMPSSSGPVGELMLQVRKESVLLTRHVDAATALSIQSSLHIESAPWVHKFLADQAIRQCSPALTV